MKSAEPLADEYFKDELSIFEKQRKVYPAFFMKYDTLNASSG